ncbi:hypothetical protein V8G54_030333 [Vigna mungo]|uniref:Uncharacterized protein n=1 Tax=Vigna mungo TaxID=3915 RepID=A0AAQ3MW70_VIGMU
MGVTLTSPLFNQTANHCATSFFSLVSALFTDQTLLVIWIKGQWQIDYAVFIITVPVRVELVWETGRYSKIRWTYGEGGDGNDDFQSEKVVNGEKKKKLQEFSKKTVVIFLERDSKGGVNCAYCLIIICTKKAWQPMKSAVIGLTTCEVCCDRLDICEECWLHVEDCSTWVHIVEEGILVAILVFNHHDLLAHVWSGKAAEVTQTNQRVGNLQKELTKLLRRKPKVEKEISELLLDIFLNCPSSLEVDRRISNVLCSESDDKEEDIEKTLSVIIDKCKDICADNRKKTIGKKSISFLLKKIFVCRSGFASTPSLRDTLQESIIEKPVFNTTFEDNASQENLHLKLFLDIIHGNVHRGEEDDKEEESGDGSKWVKIDSECKLHFVI